ncbi:MAG: thioredoxin family protein [Myxococcales bacterium]|nr:thioredoxin family protein [Myxococcales bacterium]
MSDRTMLKFSSEDCGVCFQMARFDHKIAAELGMDFVEVKLQDAATYRKYRKILMQQVPDKADMGWPTYIAVDDPEGDFAVLGMVKGGHHKGAFREAWQALLAGVPEAP